ncbi:hypothetical protein EJ04DRAFT_603240 [Polyplosphaeria fusca]|uniref:Uncharacterized protein n=1 Tax=Polyplosphaeria fusca TaxID=682080 RepID=A0A9P4R003_9PLEO|nr:hypothetical protein EJ04DRAFT_603240 [Polyplosphaeria fusca]
MAELDHRHVYTGFWVEHGAGSVMGATITTTVQTSTLVVAIVAILSSLGTAHLWNLVTFIVHQIGATGRPRYAILQQQQALLRTQPSPTVLIADIAKLIWSWKRKHNTAFLLKHSAPLGFLGIFFAATTILAGVFSSYIISGSNIMVLVDSPTCGLVDIYNMSLTDAPGYHTALNTVYWTNIQGIAASLAQGCYKNSTGFSGSCNTFVESRIGLDVSKSKCPWDASLCIGGSLPAIDIDSGLLDMRTDFGLNLPPESGVKYRRKATCAVLSLTNRTWVEDINSTTISYRPILPNEKMVLFDYGSTARDNSTFAVSLLSQNISTAFSMLLQLNTMDGDYQPSQEFRRKDADFIIKMMPMGIVSFLQPVDDPVFAAHRPFVQDSNLTVYLSDTVGTPVGCSYSLLETPGANDLQQAVLQLLITGSYFTGMQNAREVLATSKIYGRNVIPSLPNDQWVQEALFWASSGFAGLQMIILDYAAGPGSRVPEMAPNVKRAQTPAERELCGIMMVRQPGGFVNISVFGLAFVIAVTCTLTLADLSLLKFLIAWNRFREMAPTRARLEHWIQDGVLQIQRRAYEGQNQGSWTNLDKEIPVTVGLEKLDDQLQTPIPKLTHSQASPQPLQQVPTQTSTQTQTPTLVATQPETQAPPQEKALPQN